MTNVKNTILYFLKQATENKAESDSISFKEKARLKREEEEKRETILKKASENSFDKKSFLKEVKRRKKSEEKNNEYLRSLSQLREEIRVTKEQCQIAYNSMIESIEKIN